MSFAGFATNTLLRALGVQGTIKPRRNIGPMIANVTVEEIHNDEVEITQHPVERTADITDHAYPLPPTLVVRIGYAPAGAGGGGFFGLLPGVGDPVSLNSIYQQFLDLKDARELMEVQTGKRVYQDMLIKSLAVTTDQDTENALFITVTLQHVILVNTQTVKVPQNSVQKSPKVTGNQLNAGTKNATPNSKAYNTSGAQ